jgi:methyl-accepting chemotaxis protein
MNTISKRSTLSVKLLCILGLMWLGMALQGGWSAWNTRQVMLEDRKATLKVSIELAMTLIREVAARVERGEIPLEQAQQELRRSLRAMRFTPEGYYTVYDAAYRTISHPVEGMIGKYMYDLKDSNGVYFIRHQVGGTRSQGFAYTEFLFPRPGQTEPLPKITYAEFYKPWGWTITSGLYIDDVDAAFKSKLIALSLFLLGSGGILTALTLLVIANVRKNLGGDPLEAAQIASAIAQGDLGTAIRLRQGDQASLIYHLRTMQLGLIVAITDIRAGANTIAVGSHQIATGNQDLSSRTEQQAASLEETAASMEQLTAAVSQNAENSTQAADLTSSVLPVAHRANAEMLHAIRSMEEIRGSARNMADIIAAIDAIAFQTNILALNASIEAARAGEHGRGFAVVASEVRQLAQRSALAAKEIKVLIESSSLCINRGSASIEKAGSTLQEMNAVVQRVSAIMLEIDQASSEQHRGISQVGSVLTQLDQVTQQNAALVEEAAAAAASLDIQARRLIDCVSTFRLPDDASLISPDI